VALHSLVLSMGQSLLQNGLFQRGKVTLPMSSIIEFYSALGALLIFYAALSFSPLQRMLISPAVQFLGRISFPLYLIHLPILVTLVAGLALSLDAVGMSYGFILATVIAAEVAGSVFVAWILFPICERPAIELSRKLTLGWPSPFPRIN
ncbi:acyltransferase family protein, partial [Rhizobium sp. CFBP 13717]